MAQSKKKSSPSSVRCRPVDRQVHDDTSIASSITECEKHNRMQNSDTVTETDTGSVAHGDSDVQSQPIPIMLNSPAPNDQPLGPSMVYFQTSMSKPTIPLTVVVTLDPTCSPLTPADHHNSLNNLYSINEFPNLPVLVIQLLPTARTTKVVPSNAGITSSLSQGNPSRSINGNTTNNPSYSNAVRSSVQLDERST